MPEQNDEVRAAIERARNKSEIFRNDIQKWTRDYGSFLNALADEPAVCRIMREATGQGFILAGDMCVALKALAKECER